MNRKEFLHKSMLGVFAFNSLNDLKKLGNNLNEDEARAPVFFIGHGSPMNGIEDNEFSKGWVELGKEVSPPKAVLCISAHWFTKGTYVTAMDKPHTIHDFDGFPDQLSKIEYPAPGNPALAKAMKSLIYKTAIGLDHEWGLDHGTWSVVRRMFPEAKIPVLQLSIDYTKGAQYHYELAKELASLRKKGVLIIGSGNMVHNLDIMDWNLKDSGYDWAIEMNEKLKGFILSGNHAPLINYKAFGSAAQLSIPSPDHYLPLIYALGLKESNEAISLFNDKILLGSVSMTSVKIG